MILIIFLLQSMIWISNATQIIGDFYLCEKNDEIINLEINCKNVECLTLINTLRLYSKFEDEFNFISKIDGKIVVYSSQEQLFSTTCIMVKEIWLPEAYDQCTKDLPVIINSSKIAYMTKTGILRSKSHLISCKTEPDFFQFNEHTVIKQKKKNSIKKNIITFSSLLSSFIGNNNSVHESIKNFIQSNFESNEYFLIYRNLIDVFLPIFFGFIFGKKKALKLRDYFTKNKTAVRRKISHPCDKNKDLITEDQNQEIITAIITANPESGHINHSNHSRTINWGNTQMTSKYICEAPIDACNCKQQCINKKCPCLRNDKNCSENCHNGQSCKNKKN